MTAFVYLKKILHKVLPFKNLADFAFKSSMLKSGLEKIGKICPRDPSCKHKTGSFGKKYSRMDQGKFVEKSLWKIWRDVVCLSRSYPFKFCKDYLPQILLGPFLNTLSHLEQPTHVHRCGQN